MNARQLFALPFITLSCVALVHGVWALASGGGSLQWMGVVIAAAPAALLFASMLSFRIARTSSDLVWILIGGLAGGIAAVAGAAAAGVSGHPVQAAPLVYGVLVGLVGVPAYIFWYSKLPAPGGVIAVGEPLPDFTLTGVDGEPVASSTLIGAPAILMFFRGNWCPLCMAQIGEIARQYQEIERRGAVLWLVSGQSEAQTRILAKLRNVGFVHLRDEGLQVARQLGLYHPGALPAGLQVGFDDDAYLPTVVVTDAAGVVRWAHTTDNYRVRPEPGTFLRVLDSFV